MTNKAPFCAFLWITITLFSRQIRSLPNYKVGLWSLPAYQVGLWFLPAYQVGPRNPCNLCHRYLCPRYPRLINDLRSTKVYVRKNKLFLQNEPNFRKSQVSLSVLLIGDYVQLDTWSIRKKQSQTKPNKPKTNPILANKTPERTQFKPNSNPIYPVVASGEAGTNPIPPSPNLAVEFIFQYTPHYSLIMLSGYPCLAKLRIPPARRIRRWRSETSRRVITSLPLTSIRISQAPSITALLAPGMDIMSSCLIDS